MFIARGIVGGEPYTLRYDEAAEPPVQTTPYMQRVLDAAQGNRVELSPTGPFLTVDYSRDGVLGALYAYTTLHSVAGDAPDLRPNEPGVVY